MKRIFFAVSILIASLTAHAELVVVVNPNTAVTSLSTHQLSRIFLGQTGVFPNGSTAIALDGNDALRNRFYQEVLQKNPEQINKYWTRMIFTGKARLPREIRLSDIKMAVAETPGAITYMDRNMVDHSVRVIHIENDSK